jgi:uncharacterized protein YbcI
MTNPVQNQQTELARSIGKLLRDNFGKGPDSIFVTIKEPVITVYLKHFLSPTEKVLLDQEQVKIFFQTRDAIMIALIPKIKAYMTVITGMEINEFYYDWGIHNGSGIFVGLGFEDEDIKLRNLDEDYRGKREINEEVLSISQKVQRAPVDLFSYQINSRTILVFRKDILVPIEKELIRQGYEEVLRITKQKLEKSFEAALKTEVTDIFVDWDFGRNKSVIVLIHQPHMNDSN